MLLSRISSTNTTNVMFVNSLLLVAAGSIPVDWVCCPLDSALHACVHVLEKSNFKSIFAPILDFKGLLKVF